MLTPLHGVGAQFLVVHITQCGLEGEDDVLVGGDLSAGLAGLIDIGALDEAVPADVVGGVVFTGENRALPATGRGLDGLGTED